MGRRLYCFTRVQDILIRANIWKPISSLEASIGGFLYDICHDHNFDILTIGYAGPGYKARTYEYSLQGVEGVLGEEIDLVPNWGASSFGGTHCSVSREA